jgi:hypothetical protein
MGTPIEESRGDVERRTQMGRQRASASRRLRPWRTLAAALAVTLTLAGATATRAAAAGALADVLILGPTATTGLEASTVAALGRTSSVAITATDWANGLAANPPYKAIILGDPNCSMGSLTPANFAMTAANAQALANAVTGNVIIMGTDPTAHQTQGGAQLWRSAISFALANPPGVTGAAISLSCYYDYGGATSPTQVHILDGFGIFMTRQFGCQTFGGNTANNVAFVAVHPALTGLAPGVISNWYCSGHNGFLSWSAPGFIPWAIVTDSSLPPTFTGGSTLGGVVTGSPYILIRSKEAQPVQGILKVCKVADIGVAVGTPFTFTAGISTFTVPAGPPPGGTCVIGPSFPVGTTVTVDEVVPAGHVVSSIAVAPPSQQVGPANLAAGTVNVMIGIGVTEVTFTDKRTGFLEICKQGHVGGNFTFNVNPGNLGPFVVPAGACSPAIEVAAGSVVIHEMPTLSAGMIGCATIPPANQIGCNTGTHNSTVTVVPGNVSTMTIALVTNGPLHPIPPDGAAATGHIHGTTGTTLACAPNPAPLRGEVTCTAKVTAVEPKSGTPTGTVSFIDGNTILATVQLSPDDGTAAFTTSTLAAGPHAILARYGGDANFGQSGSQYTVTVGQP